MSEPKPKPQGNLLMRTAIAVPWTSFIIYMLFYGPQWLFPLVLGGVAVACASELFAMVAPDSRVARIEGQLASLVIYLLLCIPTSSDLLLLAVIGIVVVGMLTNLASPEPVQTAAQRIAWSIAGPLYVGGLMGMLVRVFHGEHGGAWAMLAITSAFLSDTAGYFVGRAYGKHALAPRVSPKKTWEGTIGGLVAALGGGLVAHYGYLPSLELHHALIVSLLAAIVGQAGDLSESLIKRSTGTKDSGSSLPGHGGYLDRADAMMFCGAIVWAYRSFAI